jgi:hypothetical protein
MARPHVQEQREECNLKAGKPRSRHGPSPGPISRLPPMAAFEVKRNIASMHNNLIRTARGTVNGQLVSVNLHGGDAALSKLLRIHLADNAAGLLTALHIRLSKARMSVQLCSVSQLQAE